MQWGRCGPILYERFRDAGLRPAPRAALRGWLWLVASIPRLFDSSFRRTWARVAGWRLGSLVESCRQRSIFYP